MNVDVHSFLLNCFFARYFLYSKIFFKKFAVIFICIFFADKPGKLGKGKGRIKWLLWRHEFYFCHELSLLYNCSFLSSYKLFKLFERLCVSSCK